MGTCKHLNGIRHALPSSEVSQMISVPFPWRSPVLVFVLSSGMFILKQARSDMRDYLLWSSASNETI